MMKILISISLFLISMSLHALTLTSSVDRTDISANETLLLTVTLDKQGADSIDFSPASIQFDILSRQRSSQTSIVNGRISAKTQWTLVLSPKEAGTLVIPSFSVHGVYSDAITINVSQYTPTSTNTNDVFLESSVNKNTVYVQEQLLFTLKLYYRTSLSSYTPSEMTIPGATIELAAENNYKQTHKGQTYNILEKVYAIHPQNSESINIPAQTWQVEKASRGFNFNQQSSPYLRVRSEKHTVNVLPTPKTSTAKHWLPASKLTLEQQWQQSTITAKIGEPLTYTLSITADGLGFSQLPSIQITNTDDFTIYGDQPKTENKVSRQGIVGVRTESFAVIPKKTGKFTLPPVSVRWWNVNTNKEETIALEPQEIIVANSEIHNDALPITTLDTASNTTREHTEQSLFFWQLFSLLSSTLAIIFCILWRRHIKQPNNRITPIDNGEAEKAKSLKSLYKMMADTIENKEWQQLRVYIIEWSQITTNVSIKNSDEIIQYFPELAEVLVILEKQLYGENQVVVWDFNELIPLLKKQTKHANINTRGPSPSKNVLHDLYSD